MPDDPENGDPRENSGHTMLRRIGAATLLLLLVVLPFINWRAGAALWLCIGLTYVCAQVLSGIGSNHSDG